MLEQLTLYIDAPLILFQSERLQGPLLAKPLCLVDVLVTPVVSCSRISFGVLICSNKSLALIHPLEYMHDLLCITLPNASRTAWEVKFSEGIRLMKCFCRRFSYTYILSSAQSSFSKLARHTFCNISYTTGSASSRLAESSCKPPKLADCTDGPMSY